MWRLYLVSGELECFVIIFYGIQANRISIHSCSLGSLCVCLRARVFKSRRGVDKRLTTNDRALASSFIDITTLLTELNVSSYFNGLSSLDINTSLVHG